MSLPTKVHLVKATGFSCNHIWMWELNHKDGWELKNWCFRIVVLEKTLESPLDNKEIKPEHSLEGLLLKLKLHYFGHLMWRANSLEKTLMLGKTEDRRKRGWQRMRWLDGVIDSMDMSLSQLWEIVKDREAWHASVRGVTKNWTWLSNLTKLCSYLSSILRRAHLFFLNIICSPLNCLHSPSPFAIKMI